MLDRSRNIVLIGFMGSGKTTVGTMLAEYLGVKYVDIDEEIVSKEGISIPSIFAEKGEGYFREVEQQVLSKVLKGEEKKVISTGGGTPCFFNGIDKINKHSTSFYLKLGRKEVLRRISGDSNRPLVASKTKSELKEFIDGSLRQREQFYKKADKTLRAIDSPKAIVDRIINYVDKLKK